MSKLYELLAVERDLNGQIDKTRGDLEATFHKKPHLFSKKQVTFQPAGENLPSVTEEQSEIATSVTKELDWMTGLWSKAIDVGFQVCDANQRAVADVEVDEQTIARGVPATALLQLEHRLTELQKLLTAIPTLDSAKNFKIDESLGPDVYKAREVQTKRTEKQQIPLELAKATDKHAAQVQLISKDVVVGTLTIQEWSAMITPADKADLLVRCEALKRAVKSALSRANAVEIDKTKTIAKTMFDYVLGPLPRAVK